VISPSLRQTTFGGLVSLTNQLEHYSPYSYVGLLLGLILVFGVLISQAVAAPR